MRTLILLLISIPFVTFAQQGNQWSQYMLDKYAWNPAYAGLENSLSTTAIIRSQWSALGGNPKSQSVSAHLPYYKWNAGIGMQIYNERLGAFNTTGIGLSYGYIKDFSFGLLSFAGKVDLYQRKLGGSEVITPDGVYEGTLINHNDPILTSQNMTGFFPKATLGMFFISQKVDVGFSINDLWNRSINLGTGSFGLAAYSNLYVQGKFRLNENLLFMPSFLLKTDLTTTQMDFSAIAKYSGNVFGGISLRGYNQGSLDAVVLIMGMNLNKNYRLSYSYDVGISGLRKVHEGSHEIMLNYNLNKLIGVGQAPKIIYNPRHL